MHYDIYRYREQRKDIINNFLSDFLMYQSPRRGREIRKIVFDQLKSFLEKATGQEELHFISHSLGSVILWDLLFSKEMSNDISALCFRKILSKFRVPSITTMGSPLLFLKQLLDIEFCDCDFQIGIKEVNTLDKCQQLRWVNIIHSSDLFAYPMKAAIKNEVGDNLFFTDQYVWQCANPLEQTLINLNRMDAAMLSAIKDAHSSYLKSNIDGRITARIVTYNLLGKTKKLSARTVTPHI
jgi:hypothetical protein